MVTITKPEAHNLDPLEREHAMEQVKAKSVEPHTRFALPEVNWDELNEAGA